MKIQTKIVIAASLALLLIAGLAGGWFVYTASAQSWRGYANGYSGGCRNTQAVLDLLKLDAAELKVERQSGRSLLDIATAKGVSEEALTEALLDPMDDMHDWMAQNYPGYDAQQMTQYMRDWIGKDIRASQFGTMTDARLFGGAWSGMMGGGWMNGWNGMMNGWQGMMNGWKGMMGGRGGMMGGYTR